jgi:hypothetical protein
LLDRNVVVTQPIILCIRWPWKWPFVDISFYEQNETHIWDAAPEYRSYYVYLKTDLFPVHSRPFADLMLPAPRDTYVALRLTYGKDLRRCTAYSYSHQLENTLTTVSSTGQTSQVEVTRIDCTLLKHAYAFVHRMHLKDSGLFVAGRISSTDKRHSLVTGNIGLVEILVIGDMFIGSKVVSEPTYALTDPYKLQLIRAE